MMEHLTQLQTRYVEQVWGDDANFAEAYCELEEQVKSTNNVSKKRFSSLLHF